MSQSTSYLDARSGNRRTYGIAIAVLVHVVVVYAVLKFGGKVLQIIKPPVETKIIEEVKPPPPPPPEAPPPPPKLAAPPPPFIPPPEIKIQTPPPVESPIQTQSNVKPAEPAPQIAKPVEAPPAPKPAPAPPAPKPRLRTNVKPIFMPPTDELQRAYPRQALREGIGGHVLMLLTVNPNGDVINAVVVDSSPKRIFDKVARDYVMQFKFEKGDSEFDVQQDIAFKVPE